ncbi:hypothetical protein [Agrilutibacter solisilvae]|uniref:Tetratricopeptide repeat protein n=1 Tax=Agrilutibacter solisilvae TaxID=2763317 RepID=A0A974XZE1_9GAMM|nr:hypothetical protein [Lysobacter solisilvae]QSX78494.1 hypothetical protein I8J32_000605 [Lysobacter solisilvae]
MRPTLSLLIPLAAALALAACASAPAPTPPAAAFDGVALAATVRAAGQATGGELEVQPLRDPKVEDLRQQAAQLEGKRMYRGAADLLDRAIALQAQDPALLQDRAEVALLLRDAPGAEGFARQAIALGSAAGPLCRRHWETLLQTALLRANDRVIRRGESEAQATARVGEAAAQVRQARAQREACTVAAPQRY